MNLSKSKYCMGIQCNKLLWLEKYKPEEKEDVHNDSVLENGTEVGVLAKGLFGEYVDIPFCDDLNVMIERTKEVLKNDNIVVTEASFLYDDNFCSIDILVKHGDKLSLYEVKSSTKIHDIYYDDVSYQTYVLLKLGYEVEKVSIVYLNSNYVRGEELDLNKLFIIEDVSKIVFSKQEEVHDSITSMKECLCDKGEVSVDIGEHCVQPYDCPFFKYCTKKLPKPNVFDIRRMRNKEKFKLYHEGKIGYNELLDCDIDWKFKQQIEFELYDREDAIDKVSIKKFMNELYYPLYFLDFETYQQAIPEYVGVKPYAQIPFQYSLHYITDDAGGLEHKEFLAESGIDPRRLLAERLVLDIPVNSCVLAYNMSFEKMVIKNLASLYEDLSEHLMNIHDHMYDLMIPFKNRSYYTKDMHGSYSIKYVLPALFPNDPSLDYHHLDQVHNGSEAMNAFASLGSLDDEERDELRKNLLKYCELDTYAMVKIWERLIEISEE